MQNYYGSLCTKMYEILHNKAPQDELDFYLSYAEKGMSVLEPLCGSGRFYIPFLKKNYSITGIDSSNEMLSKLKEKATDAKVYLEDILNYNTTEKFDYIFISSGSFSLFTEMQVCRKILQKMKDLLKKGGKFVFSTDSIANKCPDETDYKISVSVKTKEGYTLLLKEKKHYDETTRTQYSPGIYELYNGTELLQSEKMDFQTHLYELGELEPYLYEIGFNNVSVYSSYKKTKAENNKTEMFLYECSL